jgi:hypothetical protein
MDANDAVMNFRAFLSSGYECWLRSAQAALKLDRGFIAESFDDWAQANWELLVERPLCVTGEYLDIYGSGSDYEAAAYSRVFFHEGLPTHEIICEAVNGKPVQDLLSNESTIPAQCRFERFVSRFNGWFDDKPPFDHVLLLKDNKQHLVPLGSVKFVLQRCDTVTCP